MKTKLNKIVKDEYLLYMLLSGMWIVTAMLSIIRGDELKSPILLIVALLCQILAEMKRKGE